MRVKPAKPDELVPANPNRRFVPAREVARITNRSIPTVHRLDGVDGFPQSVRITAVRKAWLLDEVYAWVEQKVQERDRALVRQP